MGDARNKIAKEMRDEAHRQSLLRDAKARERKPPPIKCEGCGREGASQWRPDGTFIRFFSLDGQRWEVCHIYCEFCLEPHTGMKPNELTA